jgi:hypothetical protein
MYNPTSVFEDYTVSLSSESQTNLVPWNKIEIVINNVLMQFL